MTQSIDRAHVRHVWEEALAEDHFDQDVTSLVSIDAEKSATGEVVARQSGVFAGEVIFNLLSEAYAHRLTVAVDVADGDELRQGKTLATLTGNLAFLLGIERTMLNFLQRLSGVATLTRSYVETVAGTQAKICDTRKTIPGWRLLDKYAVRCGGGKNHRMGLHDAILVKDNHLIALASQGLAPAVERITGAAAQLRPSPQFIEFEVDNLDQLEELLTVTGIDIILLDNFSRTNMKRAVTMRNKAGLKGKCQLEASGGVNLETVRAIAETGVDRIAIGALTHSAPALDIAMDIQHA